VTSHVTSADGTRIAFDHLGDGPPVVVVGELFMADSGMPAEMVEGMSADPTMQAVARR
jgi:hypothetical protein